MESDHSAIVSAVVEKSDQYEGVFDFQKSKQSHNTQSKLHCEDNDQAMPNNRQLFGQTSALNKPSAETEALSSLLSNLKSMPHTLGTLKQIGLEEVLGEVDRFLTEIIN